MTKPARSTPSTSKVKDGLQQISDFCSQVGNAGPRAPGPVHRRRRCLCTRTFATRSKPAYEGKPDPALLYYAGYLRTVDGSNEVRIVRAGRRVPLEGARHGLCRRGGQHLLLPLPLLLRTEGAGQGFPRERPAAWTSRSSRRTTASWMVQLYTPEDNVGIRRFV